MSSVASDSAVAAAGAVFAVFDHVPFAVAVGHREGRLVYANRAFSRLFSPDGHSVLDDLSQLDGLLDYNIRASVASVIASGLPLDLPPLAFTDGTGRLYSLAGSLAPDRHSLDHVVIVLYDLTDSSETTARLERHLREFKIIEEISRALHSSMHTDDILRMILAGATTREGLGFNRAFLFVLSPEDNALIGKLAIGPSSPEEAGRIWAGISSAPRSLYEVLQCYLRNVEHYDIEVTGRVRSLRIDLAVDPFFARVMEQGEWCNVDAGLYDAFAHQSPALRELNTTRCAVVPLLSRGRAFGVIVADNLITGKPIPDTTVRLLQVFASHASTAIEHAQLFEELERRASSLEAAQRKIEQVQRQITAIERSSLLAQLTYKIAHELRNPLTIIGGFAALLKSKLNSADRMSEHAQIIMDETMRLETAMTDVLNFSKSFAQEREFVDLRQVVTAAVEVLVQRGCRRPLEVAVDAPAAATVRINHDQSIQVFFDLLSQMDQVFPPDVALRITIAAEPGTYRIEIAVCSGAHSHERLRDLVTAFYENELQGGSLRMMLAFETIRYNGGEPGIGVCADGQAALYIAYPALEELYV